MNEEKKHISESECYEIDYDKYRNSEGHPSDSFIVRRAAELIANTGWTSGAYARGVLDSREQRSIVRFMDSGARCYCMTGAVSKIAVDHLLTEMATGGENLEYRIDLAIGYANWLSELKYRPIFGEGIIYHNDCLFLTLDRDCKEQAVERLTDFANAL